MELLRKKNWKFYWYDFTVRGQRYRGSTKETNITRAGKIAALKLTQAIEGHTRWTGRRPHFSNSRHDSWNGSKLPGWNCSQPASGKVHERSSCPCRASTR